MPLSLIVPTLNEAEGITAALEALAPLRARGCEVIVVDGGSSDDTVVLARPLADKVLPADAGRARQMNAGAAVSGKEILCFLHADTRLPEGADGLIRDGLARSRRSWGRFDVQISGSHPLLGMVAVMMNWRSRLSGIATGDQAIFVTRSLFEAAGRFADIPLMEDIALCRQLKHYGAPLCLSHRAITSGRRWERHGLWRTIMLMWQLRYAYWRGADPALLAQRYARR